MYVALPMVMGSAQRERDILRHVGPMGIVAGSVKRLRHRLAVAAIATALCSACSGSNDDTDRASSEARSGVEAAPDVPAPQFILDVRAAIDAVESDRGEPLEFFEVTSNEQFTNVFVAVEDATAVVAYVYIDGELQPPAPRQEGASGNTFAAADVDFVDDRILSGVSADLPESAIDAISVVGDGVGATYVLAATSSVGGFLDVVVGSDGTVFSVDPV